MLIGTFGSRSTVGSALDLVDESAARTDRVDYVDIAFDCAMALTTGIILDQVYVQHVMHLKDEEQLLSLHTCRKGKPPVNRHETVLLYEFSKMLKASSDGNRKE